MTGEGPKQTTTLTPIQRQRNVEAAALAILIERYPASLTVCELVEEMTVEVRRPGRAAEIEGAVTSLAQVGLIEIRGDLLVPTPVALRVGEMELGLRSARLDK